MNNRGHSFFMNRALEEAKIALQKEEVPIGSVVVDQNGSITSSSHNQVETMKTQTAHAEMLAIKKAGELHSDWRLTGFTLYVTIEPCAMCMNLVLLSRIKTIVYGAASPKFGYHLDNCTILNLYKRKLEIISGICEDEAAQLMRAFFITRRTGA